MQRPGLASRHSEASPMPSPFASVGSAWGTRGHGSIGSQSPSPSVSGSAACWQPLRGSQVSAVQGSPSLQSRAAWTQAAVAGSQLSTVQALPSSHDACPASAQAQPVESTARPPGVRGQRSTRSTRPSPSLSSTASQMPSWSRSVEGPWKQPVAALHPSTVHGSASEQEIAAWTQAAVRASQPSLVQAFPSSHDACPGSAQAQPSRPTAAPAGVPGQRSLASGTPSPSASAAAAVTGYRAETPATSSACTEAPRPSKCATKNMVASLSTGFGSSNWIVLTPSQMPPATDRAGTVEGPAPSTMDALATFVQAPSALPTIPRVVAAPSAGSALATRNATAVSNQRTGGLPRNRKRSVTLRPTTSSCSDGARPDGIVSWASDAASARSCATNGPR